MSAEGNHPWRASSPCTPRCVTHRLPAVPTMETVRRTAALAKALTNEPATTNEPAGTDHARLRAKAQAVLGALGITLDHRRHDTGPLEHSRPGNAHGTGTLVVANHVSWLDIVALLAVEPVTFLAKREVAGWPFVGPWARRAGTLLLDRWSLRGLPGAVDAVAARLRAGESVAAFPEATTWCGRPGGRFRRAVFQAAVDAGAPVRPVTLTYLQRGEPSTVAAFVGDDGLAASLGRVLRARELTVRVDTHAPLPPTADRRTLALHAERAVHGEAAHV